MLDTVLTAAVLGCVSRSPHFPALHRRMNVRAIAFPRTARDRGIGVAGEAEGLAPAPPRGLSRLGRRWLWLAAVGPGLMVMLADTDAGSVVTAAQSGARFGYRLLGLELILIPVLYLVMELAVRLGVVTGKGYAELVKERFGWAWAAVSVGALLVTSVGALVTEFAGIAGVGAIVGLPAGPVVLGAAAMLLVVVLSGSYRRVELIGLGLGLFECAFLVAALRAHPDPGALAAGLLSAPSLGGSGYLTMVAANVGAVVMPWMVFYQQAALVDKGVTARNLRVARVDTAVGAVVTQLVMIAILVAAGATLFEHRPGSLDTVSQISNALTPYLGAAGGRLAFALGVSGAALVAGLVVSLAAAWAFAELTGRPRSLNRGIRQEPLFYGVFAAAVIIAALLVLSSTSLVGLAVGVEVLNALLLPVILGFLIALAWTALPARYRLRLWERAVLAVVTAGVVAMGVAAVVTMV